MVALISVNVTAQKSPNIITPDTIPPSVWITPGGGTYSSTNSVPVTISWCDNQSLNATSRVVTLNGTGISTTYTTGTYPGCTRYATSTATLTLVIGNNTLFAKIFDNAGNSGQSTAGFTYAPYAVTVTPYNGSVTHGTNLTAVPDSFTVHSTGALGATYLLSASCSGAAVSSCTAPTSVTLAAGGSAKVIVSYATGANGSTGSVALTAKAQPDTTEQGSGTTNVTISAVYGVTVTADSASITRPSRTDGVQTFRVKNTGNSPANYNLAVTCPTTLFTGCSAPNALYLYAGDSAAVSVGYNTAVGAASGTLSLQATAQQDGTKSATASTSVSVTALSAIADATPGAWTALDRAHCLAFEIVRNLAAQCDAFRVTHPLPSVITHGKARTPTMVYYSDQTLGAGVAGNVTVTSAVDSVQFSVYQRNLDGTISQSPIKSRTYSWANLANSRQRVALSGVFATTGVSRYRLQAKTWTASNGWQTLGTADGEIMATYRPSYWGAGWWLAGLEQLMLGQGSTSFPDSIVMWTGGDGSMTKYLWKARVGSQDIYLAATPVDGPDTLVKELIQGPQDTTQWTRRDVNNLRVYFDSYGRHRLTVNRLNDTTRFLWPATNTARLDSIQVPSRLTYRFYYGASGTRLDSIVAPDAAGIRRVVKTERDTMPNSSLSLSIHRFTDPDGKKVSFEWVSGDGSGQWYSARTDRRGVRTALTWESSGPGLSSASTPDGLGHTTTHTFRNATSIGMDPGAAPMTFDSVYTRYDGPRVDSADVTRFWLDPLGDPAKIVNAIGQTTIIRHTAIFPGLATEVVAPSGVVTRGWFSNTRGVEDSTTVFSPYGDGRNATTKYVWDGKWDRVVTTTMPEGEVKRDSVDQQSGNVLWAAMGGDTTKFHYDAAGRVDSVLTSDGAYDKYAYDALGNLNWHRRPNGYIATVGRDNIGREVADTTSTENVKPNIVVHSYDLAGRDSLSVSYRDTDTLEVRTLYNSEGLPLSVRQRARPARAAASDGSMIDTVARTFTYDSLGRKLTEVAGG